MSNENTTVKLGTDELGEIVVAPEAIEVIIGIATGNVEGVYGMQGSLASNVAEKFGRQSYGKGINLSTDENNNLIADIYAYLKYGAVVPKVAVELQEKIKQQVFSMTGLTLSEINIHVVSIIPEKVDQISSEDLFTSDEELTK